MPFATADKSESPLDRAWAMGEKLISSKELMDPGKKILFSKYMFPGGGGGGGDEVANNAVSCLF